MTEPLRVPGEMAQPVKDHLAATLPPILGAAHPVTVSLGVPADWTAAQSKPHIGVFDDGGALQWPILARPRLRLVVWSNSRSESRFIAGRCLGVLLTHRIPGVANVIGPTALIDGRDPHNQALTAEFYATVLVRTVAL